LSAGSFGRKQRHEHRVQPAADREHRARAGEAHGGDGGGDRRQQPEPIEHAKCRAGGPLNGDERRSEAVDHHSVGEPGLLDQVLSDQTCRQD
jgi:hypothetical protein